MPSEAVSILRGVMSGGGLRVFPISLRRRLCTNIVVVGGSVPCGHGFPGLEVPGDVAATFGKGWSMANLAQALARLVAVQSAARRERHKSIGATRYRLRPWLRFRTRSCLSSKMAVQLVVVDTAVNDYNDTSTWKRCQWAGAFQVQAGKKDGPSGHDGTLVRSAC